MSMMEYQIQANTRRCTVTGRELKPGERIYTVLIDENGKFLRRDYSREAWQGTPPAEAFSFWAGRVPDLDDSRKPQFDDELLLDCFRRLEGCSEVDRVQFRYVVALLLLRRKRLRFEDTRQEQGQEILRLRCLRSREGYDVLNPQLKDEELAAVQEEVFKVLGWE